MYYHNHHLGRPCLHCHPDAYIRMVQHLIETCLLLHMSRDQCIKVLAHHASITPIVTLTVWRELQKENRHFFQAYFHSTTPTTLMDDNSFLFMPKNRSYIHRGPRFSRRNKY